MALRVQALAIALLVAVSASAQTGRNPSDPPIITPALVDALFKFWDEESDGSGLPIEVVQGGVKRLVVGSGRIVAVTEALGPPPHEQFEDYVVVACGGENNGVVFECVRVWVGVRGREVPAWLVSRKVTPYRTADGATAERRLVNVLYDARALTNGFTVRYFSPDGAEGVLEVSEHDAEHELLLKVRAPRGE